MTKTADKAFSEIQEAAKLTSPTTRVIRSMKPGEVIRQGDIYVECVKKLPNRIGEKTKNAQLAVGKTQGSRHVIAPVPAGLVIYAPGRDASPLTGPVIDSPGPWIMTHPEHGHFAMPAGVFQVSYQRDYAKERAKEIRRVQD